MTRIYVSETTKFLLRVDDHDSMDKERFEKLASKGVAVISARSTSKAMELFGRAQYDGVLTDLRRLENGKKNNNAGIELTQQIRRINSHIPIFIYTMNIDFATTQFAMSSGATLITTNPVELETALKRYGLN